MKKKLVVLSLLLGSIGMSSVGSAAETKYEVFVNNPFSVAGSGSNTTYTGGYFINDNLEVLLTPSFVSSTASSVTTTRWSATVGLNYNFMSDVADSAYIQAQVGYGSSSQTGGTSNSGLVWSAGLGKRFKIVDHVTYAPNVTFTSDATSGATQTAFALSPLQFTFLF